MGRRSGGEPGGVLPLPRTARAMRARLASRASSRAGAQPLGGGNVAGDLDKLDRAPRTTSSAIPRGAHSATSQGGTSAERGRCRRINLATRHTVINDSDQRQQPTRLPSRPRTAGVATSSPRCPARVRYRCRLAIQIVATRSPVHDDPPRPLSPKRSRQSRQSERESACGGFRANRDVSVWRRRSVVASRGGFCAFVRGRQPDG